MITDLTSNTGFNQEQSDYIINNLINFVECINNTLEAWWHRVLADDVALNQISQNFQIFQDNTFILQFATNKELEKLHIDWKLNKITDKQYDIESDALFCKYVEWE